MSLTHNTLRTILVSALLFSILACASFAPSPKKEELQGYNYFRSQSNYSIKILQDGPPDNPTAELCGWNKILSHHKKALAAGELYTQYVSQDFTELVWPNIQIALEQEIDASLKAKNPYRAAMFAQSVYNPYCKTYERPPGNGPLDQRYETLIEFNSEIETWNRAMLAKIQASRDLPSEAKAAESQRYNILAGCLYAKLNDQSGRQRTLSTFGQPSQKPRFALTVTGNDIGLVDFARKTKNLGLFADDGLDKLNIHFIETMYQEVEDHQYSFNSTTEHRLSDLTLQLSPLQIINFLQSERAYELLVVKKYGVKEAKCVKLEPTCAEIIKEYKYQLRKIESALDNKASIRRDYNEPSAHIKSKLIFHRSFTRAIVTLNRDNTLIMNKTMTSHGFSQVGEAGFSKNQSLARLKNQFANDLYELLNTLVHNREAKRIGPHSMGFADAILVEAIKNPTTPDHQFYLRAFCGFGKDIPKL